MNKTYLEHLFIIPKMTHRVTPRSHVSETQQQYSGYCTEVCLCFLHQYNFHFIVAETEVIILHKIKRVDVYDTEKN